MQLSHKLEQVMNSQFCWSMSGYDLSNRNSRGRYEFYFLYKFIASNLLYVLSI